MYNLILIGSGGWWDEKRGVAEIAVDRFLEHSESTIRAKFLPLSDEVFSRLMSLPTLFSYEFHSNPTIRAREQQPFARFGRILEIRHRHKGLEFRYEFVPDVEPIPIEKIAELASDLDINIKDNENYRSHWAVKDVDLSAVLKKNGLLIETQPVAPEIAEQLRGLHAPARIAATAKPKVFVVHGRDDGVKNEVGRWLARIGLDDIILHEQPNLGRTLITKFQEVASDVAYAIVLMTPDDVGGIAGGATAFRARQNVVFELGFFLGKVGASRVAALVVGELEKPSNYDGVVYIPYDKLGGWKLQLAKEFVTLGISFDPIKAF